MESCQYCGSEIQSNAATCAACGAPVSRRFAADVHVPRQVKGRSFIVTLILCGCLGSFGAHRFYTGSVGIAVAQLLTCGGIGIWALIDFICIITGSYRDGEGRPLVHDE